MCLDSKAYFVIEVSLRIFFTSPVILIFEYIKILCYYAFKKCIGILFMEILDLTSFENAINSLVDIINIYNSDKSNIYMRDSMIQRFEYTYSLSLKMIKRYFNVSAFEKENIDGMTFNEMIRTANRMNLLRSNLEKWNDYREKRNLTSHTYDERVAEAVVSVIPDFKDEAVFLLNKLKEKLQQCSDYKTDTLIP